MRSKVNDHVLHNGQLGKVLELLPEGWLQLKEVKTGAWFQAHESELAPALMAATPEEEFGDEAVDPKQG